jgi:preprotein translocase subunit YajC
VEASLLRLAEGAVLFAADPKGGGGDAPFSAFLPLIVIMVIFFYLAVLRPQRREQSRRQELLAGVKKNDRVVTIGGIYGVVVSVQRDADEIVLKIDETTNTKLRCTLSSISRVLGAESSSESANK